MDTLLMIISYLFGLMPFNRFTLDSNLLDYVVIVTMPIFYLACYLFVTFGQFGLNLMPTCDSICRLGNTLFTHLGCFLYVSIFLQTLLRRKNFYVKFEKSLEDIDGIIRKCGKVADDKNKAPSNHTFYITWILIVFIFAYALFHDIKEMIAYYEEYFFISVMVTSFPFFASSIVQGQFIYYVSVISERFSEINSLFEKINKECDKKNAPIAVFDIESDAKKEMSTKAPIVITEVPKNKVKVEDSESSDDDEDVFNEADKGERNASNNPTSETNLPHLFKLHDKILSLSVLTNAEFGPQCVPYMAACFVITIFGIFLETKVIFIVGGKSRLLDYIAMIYVIWSLTTMVVGYLVLRLCCNANGHSKQSAMIVHEIMQKKPAFMLGNDLYYNKMKAFTLQFLHWEGFFQFNGIGLFALDYTFIFSTVSAATSYLIVLLQFDMSAILKTEGLL